MSAGPNQFEAYRALEAVPQDFGPSAVAIGNFDGVHLGHRAILERTVTLGGERGLLGGAFLSAAGGGAEKRARRRRDHGQSGQTRHLQAARITGPHSKQGTARQHWNRSGETRNDRAA